MTKFERKVVGTGLMFYFHLTSNAAATLANNLLRSQFTEQLTPKERVVVMRVVEDMHELSRVIRALAWRLEETPGWQRGQGTTIMPYLKRRKLAHSRD